MPVSPLLARKMSTARDGVMVSALTAEMIVETAIVTANWRKNCPVIPLMKQHGTKTELSARVIARIGPVISSIALIVAVRGVQAGGDQPLGVLEHDDGVINHDADGEHQAEEGEVVQAEAHGGHGGEGADERDGNVDHGEDHRPPVLEEDQDDETDQEDGVAEGLEDLADRLADERRGVVGDVVSRPRRGSAS